MAYPTPLWCVGTYDAEGRPNEATIAWGGICNSKPPCVTISLRKATYTYGNILERKAYTISIPSEKYAKEADYFGYLRRDTTSSRPQVSARAVRAVTPPMWRFPMVLVLCSSLRTGLHTILSRDTGCEDKERGA
jgi:flavin reductase (DIM6/NTAB) family NADH-FMN oxidoreductase RutF